MSSSKKELESRPAFDLTFTEPHLLRIKIPTLFWSVMETSFDTLCVELFNFLQKLGYVLTFIMPRSHGSLSTQTEEFRYACLATVVTCLNRMSLSLKNCLVIKLYTV